MQPLNVVSLAFVQAAIMASMAGYLLDVRSVRREIDRREACGQWVAGKMGEGGAFAMRTPEEKARIAAAGSDDEVCPLGAIHRAILCSADCFCTVPILTPAIHVVPQTPHMANYRKRYRQLRHL